MAERCKTPRVDGRSFIKNLKKDLPTKSEYHQPIELDFSLPPEEKFLH